MYERILYELISIVLDIGACNLRVMVVCIVYGIKSRTGGTVGP